MSQPTTQPARPAASPDRRIRRAWWIFAGTFFLLGLIVVIRLVIVSAHVIDWFIAALIVVLGYAAIRHRQAVSALEIGRREEAESFARILSGLSRSVSPDAIVGAIVDELAEATAAGR